MSQPEQPLIVCHVREICEEHHLRLRQLAQVTDWSKSYWGRVWQGQADLSLPALAQLAHGTKISPHVWVEYVEWPVPQPCTCPCHNAREEQSHV